MSETNAPVGLSALHRTHLKLGARIQESQGWLLPVSYRSVEDEAKNVVLSAGICDIGHHGKIDVKGSEVDKLLQSALPTLAPKSSCEVRFSSASRGESASSRVQYVCRLSREHALIITQPLPRAESALGVATSLLQSSQRVYLTNLTSSLAGLNLVGPSAERIVSKLTKMRLSSESHDGSFCAEGGLAKVYALVVRRNLTLEGSVLPSFDIYFGRDYAEYVWGAVMEAGREFGIAPFGLEVHSRIYGNPAPRGGLAGGK